MLTFPKRFYYENCTLKEYLRLIFTIVLITTQLNIKPKVSQNGFGFFQSMRAITCIQYKYYQKCILAINVKDVISRVFSISGFFFIGTLLFYLRKGQQMGGGGGGGVRIFNIPKRKKIVWFRFKVVDRNLVPMSFSARLPAKTGLHTQTA